MTNYVIETLCSKKLHNCFKIFYHPSLDQILYYYVFLIIVGFLLGPLIPYMIFQLYPILTNSLTNTSKNTIQFLYPVKNFFNVQKYYYLVLLISFFGSTAIVNAFIAFDTIFVIFVQHACGMFTILTRRLESLIPETLTFHQLNGNANNKNEYYTRSIECITIHKTIIEFVKLVDSAFSFGFLFTIALNTFSLSFTAFCTIAYRHAPIFMVRYAILTFVQVFHLFNKFWQCQTLIDHSGMLKNTIYGVNWYNASPKTKTILFMVLTRAENVCKLRGGKFFDMSFFTFSRIISSAASYFAVLSSIK